MGKLQLLDCTLRDGGYVNDWRFGREAIEKVIGNMEEADVDILEIGFLKNEPYDPDRTVFCSMQQIKELLGKKKAGLTYAAMVEVVNPLPLELLERADDGGTEVIRAIVWKRLLDEGYKYCKGIADKGYRLCIQPARVDQYSDEEFVQMIEKFNGLNPLAIYVVDSWGTQYTNKLMNYIRLADKHMRTGISLGYHGHNNMMQAFAMAEALADYETERDIIIDASVFGIGRGAGNLNLEMAAKYFNENKGKHYRIEPMLRVYEETVREIFLRSPWGYSMPYFMTAMYRCNPNYAGYFGRQEGLEAEDIGRILSSMRDEDKIIYSEEKAGYYLNSYRER